MISNRLKTIAEMLPVDASVADIGCDHGLLARQLRERGNQQLIICADNKPSPLLSARMNLAGFDNIVFVLSDGATKIRDKVDYAVLSGLGYNTVRKILKDSDAFFRSLKGIIIQINSHVAQQIGRAHV